MRELVNDLREQTQASPVREDHRLALAELCFLQSSSASDIQTTLINTLIQAKAIGDKKMQLSQQMLDATERQSKKLKIAHQKYSENDLSLIFVCLRCFFRLLVESITQQSNSNDPNQNEIDSDNEYDHDMGNPRSLSTKASTTSLWKRKATTNNASASTLNLKRKCVTNSDHNNDQRDKKKPAQRSTNSNTQNTASGNGKRIKLNNDSSSAPSDEPTYCLCSQVKRSNGLVYCIDWCSLF